MEPSGQQKPDAIEVKNLSMRLPARGMSGETILTQSPAAVGGEIAGADGSGKFINALDCVSFAIKDGASLAVIGRNGSGKSTLMRVLAGIYPASSGSCLVKGRVTTLFSNQIAVNYNATGLENIRLVAMVMGLGFEESKMLVEDVADFSELGEYLNLPLQIYSSGMRARLGFGIATGVNPDVLLIDEVFGTGDQDFKIKARKRLESLLARSGATVMASHSLELLREFCSRALWLDRGKMIMEGPFGEVARAYVQARSNTSPNGQV